LAAQDCVASEAGLGVDEGGATDRDLGLLAHPVLHRQFGEVEPVLGTLSVDKLGPQGVAARACQFGPLERALIRGCLDDQRLLVVAEELPGDAFSRLAFEGGLDGDGLVEGGRPKLGQHRQREAEEG
jgi:hypothetical protein